MGRWNQRKRAGSFAGGALPASRVTNAILNIAGGNFILAWSYSGPPGALGTLVLYKLVGDNEWIVETSVPGSDLNGSPLNGVWEFGAGTWRFGFQEDGFQEGFSTEEEV